MRIAIVMAGNEEGGLEKHVEELVNGLARAGQDVTWVAHPKYAERAPTPARFAAVDLTRSRTSPTALFRLWRTLKTLQPDVIHVHGGKALAMVATLRPWLDSRLVATVHGLKKRNRGLSRADRVIAVSQHLARHLDHPHVQVIYNGVSQEAAASGEQDWACGGAAPSTRQRPAWLAVGRLVEEKGFDILIKAFASVPGSLWIAGDGPLHDLLRTQIERQGDEDRIELLGHRDDVPQLMHDCDALVISSRREGFSYVFAEALVHQCPVVSTDVPIANEVLPADLICPTNDPEALAQLMRNFSPNRETVKSLADFARSHLSLDAMLGQTTAVYRNALSQGSR